MKKQQKLQLEAVIDAIVDGNTEAAKASFHEYLRSKTQGILIGEAEDEDEDEEKDDKKDEDDKDDKKPEPFKKKDKEDDKDEDKKDKKDE